MQSPAQKYSVFLLIIVFLFPTGIVTAQESIQVDLIMEADSRTPSFYAGRALPVANQQLQITAIPHSSSGMSPGGFTYRWKLNNTILFGGPVAKLSQIIIVVPDRPSILGVTVYGTNGSEVGSAYVEIQPAQPELYFYEDNPLRSMSRTAINGTHILVGDETTVRAEPYFTASNISSNAITLKWTLDGQVIQNFGSDMQALTLRGTGGGGKARVGFELRNTTSLQFLQDFFTIQFES